MNTLEKKREEINTIDAQLVSLFEKRMHTVEDIINYKLENNIPILDTGREAENIARTTKLIQDPQLIQYFENWYRYTMQVSKDYQQQIKNAENG
ncbi:MAG: chorismate mutase [Erysipelotrichaceae bacterium]|nr:chorismate mutase [Erysipelotrichaceae bacterium]MDY6034317.1 chorismate mutase [Bulleidia sp.]